MMCTEKVFDNFLRVVFTENKIAVTIYKKLVLKFGGNGFIWRNFIAFNHLPTER